MSEVYEWRPRAIPEPYREQPHVPSEVNVDDNLIARYQRHLRDVGLADPTAASATYAQFRELREAAGTLRTEQTTAGERIRSAKDVLREGDPDEPVQQAARSRRALLLEATKAYSAAVRAVRDHGEDAWLAVLRTVAAEAVTRREQPRWDALVRLGAFLRDEVGAMESIGSGNAGIDWTIYHTARPDAVWRWRMERTTDAVPIGVRWAGTTPFVSVALRGAPFPTVADLAAHPDWQPGIYAAAEAVLNITRALAEQDRRFFEAHTSAPRRALMAGR